jgi:alpha-L-fucosidase
LLTWEALAERPVPSWFPDAKLGILVSWGPASVPAWAPPGGDLSQTVAERGWEHWFSHNPYAEWYANSMLIPGSATQAHHRARWGRLARYDTFARAFRQGLKDWDPGSLVQSLAKCGARYVVLTAKDHDGFLLWPSRSRNPRKAGWQVQRDIVGEIAQAARARGQRFGIAYSGGLDWTFGGLPIRNLADLQRGTPRSRTYAGYVDAHWRELISRYEPSLLWNDIGSPPGENLLELLRNYYDVVPDGLVNDRFGQSDLDEQGVLVRAVRKVLGVLGGRSRERTSRGLAAPEIQHADFRTFEYALPPEGTTGAWECVRGLGSSITLNMAEPEDHLLNVDALVRLLVEVVARGGNLLLGVGPGADGNLTEPVRRRLDGLGEWLKANGEAIYGSRPWGDTQSSTPDGVPIRYTTRGITTYAILNGTPPGRTIVLPSLRFLPYSGVRILGSISYVAWFQEGKDVHIRLTEPLRASPAHVISITPQPRV